MLGFILLLSLLFSGVRGLPLFLGGLLWLIMNALGIFICVYLKFKVTSRVASVNLTLTHRRWMQLYRMLEKCIAQVNEHFYKSNILLGVDDRGHLSCHKVNLIFVYLKTEDCIRRLSELANSDASATRRQDCGIDFTTLDIDNDDIRIGEQVVSRRNQVGAKLLLRYSQRWVKVSRST